MLPRSIPQGSEVLAVDTHLVTSPGCHPLVNSVPGRLKHGCMLPEELPFFCSPVYLKHNMMDEDKNYFRVADLTRADQMRMAHKYHVGCSLDEHISRVSS